MAGHLDEYWDWRWAAGLAWHLVDESVALSVEKMAAASVAQLVAYLVGRWGGQRACLLAAGWADGLAGKTACCWAASTVDLKVFPWDALGETMV